MPSACACGCGKMGQSAFRGSDGLRYANLGCLAKAGVDRELTGAGVPLQPTGADVSHGLIGAVSCGCGCGKLTQPVARGSDGRNHATQAGLAKAGAVRVRIGLVACACGCGNKAKPEIRGPDGLYYATAACLASAGVDRERK
jgi:hypothetical protein